jgi:hypothetical protein
MLGVAQAVPRTGLAGAVAELAVQAQGLLTGRLCLLVIAEQDADAADVIESPGLPGLVTGGLEQDEGRFGVPERVGISALLRGNPGEGLMHMSQAYPVVKLLVELEALGQVGARLVVVSELTQECASSLCTAACPAVSPSRVAAASAAR